MTNPIVFRMQKGGIANGYEATLLADLCDAILDARRAGALQDQQLHIAQQAEILVRGFARVGIVALVDEATGYQRDREEEDLQRLLSAYLSEERLKWASRFPREFYKQIYRLWGWTWPTNGTRRTPEVGKITNKLVYDKMPPGVLEQIRSLNPKRPGKHYREAKHHQHLSENLGQPQLHDHLMQLIAIMRVSNNRRDFERNFARAFPSGDGGQQVIDGIEPGNDPRAGQTQS